MQHANLPLTARIPPKGLFVTGSDTGVGKTHLSVGLLRWLRSAEGTMQNVGAYKPAASGISGKIGDDPTSDVALLGRACDDEFPLQMICPQVFEAPLAPCLAAEREGRKVDSSLLRLGATSWFKRVSFLIVEGAGGILSPLTFEETNLDLAIDLRYPLLLVVSNRLGAVNQALSTCLVAESSMLPIQALIFNETECASDIEIQKQTFCDHRRLFLSAAAKRLRGPIPRIFHSLWGAQPPWDELFGLS